MADLCILIADDSNSDRMQLAAIVKKEGHYVIEAKDGEEALLLWEKKRPDLILLDALMPKMDGFEVAQKIKAQSSNELIPIIFLTSLQDAASLARCLQCGGDDFLSKPYNRIILKAKIEAFSRMRIMHRKIQEHAQQLLVEQKVAKTIFDNVAHLGCLDLPNLEYALSPLAVFNGDIVLAERKPDGGMYVFLGDFTGHGLPAAIGAMPLAEIFYGMAGKGFSIQEILIEINTKLGRILPVEVFCCAAMVDLDFVEKRARIFVGGLPELYLCRQDSGEIETVASNSLPLGVMSRDSFKPNVYDVAMHNGDRIFLWSDGIIEARAGDGSMYGEQRLKKVFAQQSRSPDLFKNILNSVDDFIQDGERDDDITLLCAAMVDAESIEPKKSINPTTKLNGPMDWSMQYQLQAQSLRAFNPLPLVLHIVTEVEGIKRFSGQIYTMLAELYSNALEHGILKLDSSLKENAEGFAEYYSQRQCKLEQLTQGCITISLQHHALKTHSGGQLTVRIEDSGQGFDYKSMQNNAHPSSGYCGRGMPLIRTICSDFYYEGTGNIVNAVVTWPLEKKVEN